MTANSASRGLILRPDSPLRGIPEGYSVKQVHYLEGLRFCFEMADLAYSRLEETLIALSLAAAKGDPARHGLVASALMDAWSIIDQVDRTRNLLLQLPYLKQRRSASPGVAVFQERTNTIPALRNLVQHMTTDLSRPQADEERPWGHLAWLYRVSETPAIVKSYSLIPGWYRGGTYGICGQQDRGPDRPISRVILERKGESANLTFVHGAMRVLARDLEAALVNGAPTGAQRSFDPILSVDVVINPGSGAEKPTPE
jgi:hypothetical protein